PPPPRPPPAPSPPLPPQRLLLDHPGRTLLRHPDPETDPPRILHQRSRPDPQDQPLPPALQRQPEAVPLDQVGRRNLRNHVRHVQSYFRVSTLGACPGAGRAPKGGVPVRSCLQGRTWRSADRSPTPPPGGNGGRSRRATWRGRGSSAPCNRGSEAPGG